MPQRPALFAAPLALALALIAADANAQGDPAPEFVPETVGEAPAEQVVDATLSVGASANLSSNDSVIGQPDGQAYTVGFNAKGRLIAIADNHESLSRLTLTETFTRTPVVPEFVRTTDALEAETLYYYHLPTLPWLGPFGRAKLQTSLFIGEDVQPEPIDYLVLRADGTVEARTTDRLRLTDPFFPLILRESLGFFARPIDMEVVSLELRAGAGAREVFANGQFAISDNGDTPEIDVVELRSYVQLGAELVASARGELAEDKITYETGAELLTPFYNSIEQNDRDALKLTNIDFFARLSFKLLEWASVDYEFKAVKQPLLLDEFQIQHNLLFTVGYSLLEEG